MIVAAAPVVFEEVDSTMLEARRRAERGECGPVWLVARRQTAGRGRRGRVWVSETGNLYTTYLFPTDRSPAQLALLGFAAGLAIAEAIDAELGAGRATLKWPNDVLVDGAKVSGLLLDSGSTGATNWAALGIGVNLASAPDVGDQRTTSVSAEAGRAVDVLGFLDALQTGLAHWDVLFMRDGFEPLRREWLRRAHGLGAEARVAMGDTSMSGRIAGLSSRGELELDTLEGRRLIAAGDVFLLSAA